MSDSPQESMEQVIRDDGRYPPEAYEFLHAGLGQAVKDHRRSESDDESQESNHVTGNQMCCALRDLAIERWGLLAQTVLDRWNVRATIDFGNMVYLLIRHSFMRKTDEDSIEDFRDVYEFKDAFKGADHFELTE